MAHEMESPPLGRRPEGRTLITASWVVGHKEGSHTLLRNGQEIGRAHV